MKTFRWPILAGILLAQFFGLSSAHAQAQGPGLEMAAAANNFLAALSSEQREKAVFELSSDERVNWHFVPRERKGLPFKEMSPAQQHLAHVLLNSALSHRGYFKAVTIMSLEQVLREIETRGPVRDAQNFFITVFGAPGKDVWGWRIEGHHISLNFTVRGETVLATTPSFLGSNPAKVQAGPREGLRVLEREEDLARKLAKSFDEGQRKSGIISDTAPRDILTGNSRKAKKLEPAGLPVEQMNSEQQKMLKALIEEYIGRNRREIRDADWAKIEKAGWAKVSFAWAGGLESGQGHYYRIQGPTFLFEYDNTQNNANHIHTVWRDFENDFGEDLLRKHYETEHAR